jgi:hypothetical protein
MIIHSKALNKLRGVKGLNLFIKKNVEAGFKIDMLFLRYLAVLGNF